jgi:uncharacterized phage-associated protein
MPKYFCDYCDTYLTHDSPSVRKSHLEGWRHKAAVRAYYSQFEQNAMQDLIEQKIRMHEMGMGMSNFNAESRKKLFFLFLPSPPSSTLLGRGSFVLTL